MQLTYKKMKTLGSIIRKLVLKIFILLQQTHIFNATCLKIPMAFFIEIEKAILKFIHSHKGPQITKSILRIIAKLEASHVLISK